VSFVVDFSAVDGAAFGTCSTLEHAESASRGALDAAEVLSVMPLLTGFGTKTYL